MAKKDAKASGNRIGTTATPSSQMGKSVPAMTASQGFTDSPSTFEAKSFSESAV